MQRTSDFRLKAEATRADGFTCRAGRHWNGSGVESAIKEGAMAVYMVEQARAIAAARH